MSAYKNDAIEAHRLRVIKVALKFYLATGMKVNRSYTITNMLRAATELTGKTYKRGQGAVALADMEEMIASQNA